MSKKFIPNGDSEFAFMAKIFADNIAKDPDKWGFDDFSVEMLSRRVREYREALSAAVHPRTRTPATIMVKDEKRKKAEQIVRRTANVIRASCDISAAKKRHLWIKERPKKLGKRTVPFAAPVLQYLGAPAGPNSGMHLLRFAEGWTFINRSKPNGAVRVELFADLVMQGDPVPQFPGQYLGGRPWYLGSFTSSPMKVKHPVPPVPMLVVYWARWADAKCNVGPFSQTCVARMEGGMGGGTIGLIDTLLGPMPEVRQLERDPKQITVITQLRQIEQVQFARFLGDNRASSAAAHALEGPSATPAPEAPALPDAA